MVIDGPLNFRCYSRAQEPGRTNMPAELLADYMIDCRTLVLEELERLIPRDQKYRPILYDLVFEYPLREAKALRPTLCIATCRALGGTVEAVARSATVLELYHNAFLVHDDVEDGSELRRDGPTLHREHGVSVAVNVGDAMLALALEPLLDNMRLLSLGKALRIRQVVARMARESAEGQALELAWIKNASWSLSDKDYLRMVHKKTSHYTFLAPVIVGAIVADAAPERLATLRRFATALGAAFQIQDDVLNLTGDAERIGKEIDGDLWEGKHTLMLLHAVRSCSLADRRRAIAILRKSRPIRDGMAERVGTIGALVERLSEEGQLSSAGRRALQQALARALSGVASKTDDDVAFLKQLIFRQRSVEYALGIARRWAGRARSSLNGMSWLEPSVHRDFLRDLTDFVVDRDH
jgi:geranylgeranyl diphosphate synthase, type II